MPCNLDAGSEQFWFVGSLGCRCCSLFVIFFLHVFVIAMSRIVLVVFLQSLTCLCLQRAKPGAATRSRTLIALERRQTPWRGRSGVKTWVVTPFGLERCLSNTYFSSLSISFHAIAYVDQISRLSDHVFTSCPTIGSWCSGAVLGHLHNGLLSRPGGGQNESFGGDIGCCEAPPPNP